MANYKLVTFDAYTGLADLRATLTPVVARLLNLTTDAAEDFPTTWRDGQLRTAALSNALKRGRPAFAASIFPT